MNQAAPITTALCLPAPDIDALVQGRVIAAIPTAFINSGQRYALCPSDTSTNVLPIEQYYRSSLLDVAQTTLTEISLPTVRIKAWAECQLCKILDETTSLEVLSELTLLTANALREIISQRQYIFLAYLRTYLLPQFTEIQVDTIGQFIGLSPPLKAADINKSTPVLSDRTFAQRKQQLEELKPPLYPELEDLQAAIMPLTEKSVAAKKFEEELKLFLGWSDNLVTKQPDPDLEWIKTIAQFGNSSDGHTFERLVRKGLRKLRFTGRGLDPDSVGGAGGMDFYCEEPYPVVGECKATKTETVSDGTPAQLLKIGMNHLGKDQYDYAVKLIVAAGDLNFYALRTATENQMNVIRPETLQRLVEMQAEHDGAINLIELRQCLQQAPFGSADDKVNSYIDEVSKKVRLRSQIVQVIKQLTRTDKKHLAVMEIRTLYNANFVKNFSLELDDLTVHEVLIELSSPLVGYVGRVQASSLHSDRFYFLHDLIVE